MRNDEAGRPLVTLPDGRAMAVSLSHRTGVAVAALGDGPDVGIDLEVVEPRSETFAAMCLSDDERALGAGHDRDVFVARAWTAKEAVAKADGTGLQGRPKDFVVRQIDGDWTLVNDRWVHTTQEGDLIVSTVRER